MNRKFVKVNALLLSMLLVSGIFTGCQQSSKQDQDESTSGTTIMSETTKEPLKTVKLKFASAAGESGIKINDFALNGVQTVYPEIEVETDYTATQEEYFKKIPILAASNGLPDILGFTNDNSLEYIVKGIIIPFDELLQKINWDMSDLSSAAVDGWKYDGKIYGIPVTIGTSLLAVNMDMWKAKGLGEMPGTFEQVLEAAKALTDRDKGIYGICANIDPFHITQYAIAYGGGWNYGKTINTPENLAGLNFYVNLYKKYDVAVSPMELGLGWDGEVFAKGKAAMSTGGPWYIGYVKESTPDMNWKYIPIPEGTKRVPFNYGGGYVITSSSKNKEEAVKLIKYASRKEAQVFRIDIDGNIPTNLEAIEVYKEKNPELLDIIDLAVTKGVPMAYPLEAERFKTALIEGIQKMVLDKESDMTVEKLLQELEQEFGV